MLRVVLFLNAALRHRPTRPWPIQTTRRVATLLEGVAHLSVPVLPPPLAVHHPFIRFHSYLNPVELVGESPCPLGATAK